MRRHGAFILHISSNNQDFVLFVSIRSPSPYSLFMGLGFEPSLFRSCNSQNGVATTSGSNYLRAIDTICYLHNSGAGFLLDNHWTKLTCKKGNWINAGVKCHNRMSHEQERLLPQGQCGNARIESLQRSRGTMRFRYFRYLDTLKILFTFQFHPQISSSRTVPVDWEKYEVDIIHSLTIKDCNSIVVISPLTHFGQWWRDAYVE